MEFAQTDHRSNQRAVQLALSIVVLGLLIAAPLLFAVGNALALSAWTVLQLLSLRRSALTTAAASGFDTTSDPLFFSIHVATHNEPPKVVCKTLDALARIQYSTFEVIVIDNNTSDRTLWEPVRAHCRLLGPNFTFLHRMNVIGAKAGALNIAREVANSETQFIVTVDADYSVTPEILLQACAAIRQTQAAYIQFPQAYQAVQASQQPLINELGDYFVRHAQSSVSDRSMLLTGTLSVINVDALDAVDGWPTTSITEDAELGLMLQCKGFKGVFVNQHVGEGLLPPSAFELRKQRHRWTSGNVQVLVQALMHAPRSLKISHVSQLSAWCAFVAIPYALVIALPLVALVLPDASSRWAPAMEIALASVMAQMLGFLALSRTRPGFFSVKWALVLSSSWATVSALISTRQQFKCTRRVAGNKERTRAYLLVCYLPLLAALVSSTVQGWWSALVACLLMLSSAFYYLVLDAQLKITKNSTPCRSTNRRASHVL